MVVLEHVFAAIGIATVAVFLTVVVWFFRNAKQLTPVIRHITKVLKEEANRLREEREKEENHDV